MALVAVNHFPQPRGDTIGSDNWHHNCIRIGWLDSHTKCIAKRQRGRLRELLANTLVQAASALMSACDAVDGSSTGI